MPYTVTFTGVNGTTRRTGLSAGEAVSWHKSYSPLSADFLIRDEAGRRAALDDLKKELRG